MFSRVVEGADPYRDTEKPFISSPPNGCANTTREEQAPPLPRSREIRYLCAAERRCERTVEDACPYNEWGDFGAPPYCFVLAVYFMRADMESAPTMRNRI